MEKHEKKKIFYMLTCNRATKLYRKERKSHASKTDQIKSKNINWKIMELVKKWIERDQKYNTKSHRNQLKITSSSTKYRFFDAVVSTE